MTDEHRAEVEIDWIGDGEAGRRLILEAIGELMEKMLEDPDVDDPSIGATLNA